MRINDLQVWRVRASRRVRGRECSRRRRRCRHPAPAAALDAPGAAAPQVILLCFVCAAVALFSPIEYAWIGPVSAPGARLACKQAPVPIRARPLTGGPGVVCMRAACAFVQVVCLLVLVCCSDVRRPAFKHTYGYASNQP